MFCEKCGKELSEYKICGSPVGSYVSFDKFDARTGKQRFYFSHPFDFHCQRWHHLEGAPLKIMRQANIYYHHDMALEKYFVYGDNVKDGFLTIGTCDYKCCPYCGDTAPIKAGCFIATAAFGTPLAPEVIYLRHYRDDVLSTHGIGRGFIRLYYLVSPVLAQFISYSRMLKAACRFFLTHLVLFLRRGH